MKKRVTFFTLWILVVFCCVTVLAEEQSFDENIGEQGIYYIVDNDERESDSDEEHIYKWGINGGNVASYKMTNEGTAYHPGKTYNIALENETPMDSKIEIVCDLYNKTNSKTVPMINTQPGLTKLARINEWNNIKKNDNKISVQFENGKGTLTLYVYSKLGDMRGTAHTFNFYIEKADVSKDPKIEDVSSLAITKMPMKTTYFAGEMFDPAGMEVSAKLKGGETVKVSGYNYRPSEMLSIKDTYVTISFGRFAAKQKVNVLPGTRIGNVEITNGQLMGDIADHGFGVISRKDKAFDAVVLYGEKKGNFIISVDEGAEIFIGGKVQRVKNGNCKMSLDTSTDGISTVVCVKSGENYSEYIFTCYSQMYDGIPTSVIEYLCLASQYTNGSSLGPYGLNPVSTLRGAGTTSETAFDGINGGPVSLGNFGGYIIYYYKDAIFDDPRNPYGIDFIVYGNSYDGSSAFAEPGNVLVSQDGKKWFNLAGALHYDNNAIWNYSITYTNEGSRSLWTDNRGLSGYGDKYPQKSFYPLFPWTEELECGITVEGVLLEPSEGTNQYGNTEPPYPDFGYADSGDEGVNNKAFNPYTGTTERGSMRASRTYSDKTDGFDLKWAVDENGYPVELTKGIHYIKIQTASNISNSGIGEKSTEVHMVRTAAPSKDNVGISDAPSAVIVDDREVELAEGINTYDIAVNGIFEVEVEVSEGANVYINGIRTTYANFEGIPDHKIIRIIVQEDEKAPRIYYLTLSDERDDNDNDNYTTVILDADMGRVGGKPSIIRYYDANTRNIEFPVPIREGDVFLGWYSGEKRYEKYEKDMPSELILKAVWEKENKKTDSLPINVTFRLIGSTLSNNDVDLGHKSGGTRYITWIATKEYTMNADDMVYDLFIKAMEEAGLNSVGQDKNYVKTITAPDVLGGYELSEFTNGVFSGWMYTINGKHPGLGLREQELKNGDQIIWHYVNDYRYEIEDWFDDPEFPSLGDGEEWNKWLEAEDKDPDKDTSSDS